MSSEATTRQGSLDPDGTGLDSIVQERTVRNGAGREVVVQVTIVSFRTADLVIKSLQALALEKERQVAFGISITCYVIDNSQEDYAVIERVVRDQGYGDWVTLVRAERNGGFAYGNNRGFEFGFSQAHPPDYFYLLNPDAEIRPGAIGTLVNFMESNPGAATGASGIEDHGGVLWPYAFRFPNIVDELLRGVRLGPLSRLLGRFAIGQKKSGKSEPVDWFPGAAMMCRAKVVLELGGMDETYFLYFEETDFCLKLSRNGWKNWYVPDSRVIHETGVSTGVTAAGNESRRLPKYWFESRRRYFLKNHGLLYALTTDIVALCAHSLGQVQLRLRGKGSQIREHFLRDLFRESCLMPGQRKLEEPREKLLVILSERPRTLPS